MIMIYPCTQEDLPYVAVFASSNNDVFKCNFMVSTKLNKVLITKNLCGQISKTFLWTLWWNYSQSEQTRKSRYDHLSHPIGRLPIENHEISWFSDKFSCLPIICVRSDIESVSVNAVIGLWDCSKSDQTRKCRYDDVSDYFSRLPIVFREGSI